MRRNNFSGAQILQWFRPLVENLSASNYPGAAFLFALNADRSVTAFRSEIGQEDLAGLKTNLQRIHQAQTTEAQYRRVVALFAQQPQPAGTLLPWVCRGDAAYLDLTTDRLDMTPA
jgi:hypothetical protein